MIEEVQFQSTHKLDFEVAEWVPPIPVDTAGLICFRVGTCEGLWKSTETTFDIVAIKNNKKGNGHLQDVLEWFEYSCNSQNRNLRVMEILNADFHRHLIEKRGFVKIDNETVLKNICTMKQNTIILDGEKIMPPDSNDSLWEKGAKSFSRKEVAYLLYTQRAMISNDMKSNCGNDLTPDMFALLDNPRMPEF